LPAAHAAATKHGPLLAEQDALLVEGRAQAAFWRFKRFQEDFDDKQSISGGGLRSFCAVMAMDISVTEVDRLYMEAVGESKGSALDFDRFAQAARTIPFFSNLVIVMTAPMFQVGRGYDYSNTTRENYRRRGDEANGGAEHHGAEAERQEEVERVRQVLPAELGATEYRPDRAAWQNALVLREAAPPAEPAPAPWLVFTLAPRGARPRFVLSWLAEHGLLPLRWVTPVGAEKMAQSIRELPLYVRQRGSDEGLEMVWEEAELLEALACEVAMARGQHVWVSCAPRDASRVASRLRCLRARHPSHRVAVLDIRADAAALERRHREALRDTGRGTPETVELPREADLEALADLCDLVARVDASEDQPILQRVEAVDKGGSWVALGRHFAAPAALPAALGAQFPLSLRPLRLQRVTMNPGLVRGKARTEAGAPGALSVDLQLLADAFGLGRTGSSLAQALEAHQGRADCMGASGEVVLPLSQAHQDAPAEPAGLVELRRNTNPHDTILLTAWLHGLQLEAPLPASALQRAGCTEDNLLTRILTRGAFVNFGQLDGGKVPGGQKAFVKSMDVPSDRPSELLLQFAPPVPLPREVVHALGSRWHAVADEALWWRGARQECWLGPGEALFGGFPAPAGGAFAYRLAPEAAGVAGCDACMFGILV